MKHRMNWTIGLTFLVAACFLTACEGGVSKYTPKVEAVTGAKIEDMQLAYPIEASGKKQYKKKHAVVDYSNTSDGYVMAQYSGKCKNVKVIIQGPVDKYTYTISDDRWNSFPLSQGNGEYRISMYENVKSNKYAQILTKAFDVELTDEFAPFLRSNKYVNYAEAPNTVATAKKLAEGLDGPMDIVTEVFMYVVGTMTYDKDLAENVQSGYVPDLDYDLQTKTGICFDYASLMTGMLRSLKIPCKLVVGYAGGVYHAWISVWIEGEGWIENVIHFDGNEWYRLDPTFASTAGINGEFFQYVGDGNNYVEKYFY